MRRSAALKRIETIISRIESGNFTDSDISILLVTMRELPKSQKSIFEVGSFVAHSDLRDKGTIKDIMLRNHAISNLRFGKDKDLLFSGAKKFPFYFPEFIKLQSKALTADFIAKKTNLSPGKTNSIIDKLNSKSTFKQVDGYAELQRPLSDDENKVINECLSYLLANDAIKHDDLINDMCNLMLEEDSTINIQPLIDKKREIFCAILCLMNNVSYLLDAKHNVSASVEVHLGENSDCDIFGCYYLSSIHDGKEIKMRVRHPVYMGGYSQHEIFDADITREDVKEGNFCYSNEKGLNIRIS